MRFFNAIARLFGWTYFISKRVMKNVEGSKYE